MSNYKVTLSYDGTGFSGVAEQITKPDEPAIRTVIGQLRPIIEMVTQSKATIVVSGRTDKGVHAREQVISFTLSDATAFEPARLVHVANKKLNPEIVVNSIEECSDDFHARFSAKSRTYRYLIDTNTTPNIFTSRFAWHVGNKLDVEKMSTAAKFFIGEQDFTSVCKQDDSMPHNIREVFKAEFVDIASSPTEAPGLFDLGSILCFEISANAFCWNMVRSIVGVLVDVGAGKIEPDQVKDLLKVKKRDSSRTFAPAHGLTLWEVQF